MHYSEICGYCGAVLMATFAFTMQPLLAIAGLTLLTIQSVHMKTHNLTILNLISIGGFLTNFL